MTQPGRDRPRAERHEHLIRFYDLIDELVARTGGPRLLSECTGRMDWPTRGVYFFFESGEQRTDSGIGPRVARVGTHALKTGSRSTLWQRLRQHRGSGRSGGGNHRGSIFRLLVGAALAERDGLAVPTWGEGSSAPKEVRERERAHEQRVTEVLGRMRVAWVAIADDPGPESLRGIIERNSIALLSGHGGEHLDPPSPAWLGHHCPRLLVASSGLWNQNHVVEGYDPAFLERLESLIRKAGGAS